MGQSMTTTILVINPNSTERITDQIEQAVKEITHKLEMTVEVVTSPCGPTAIESDEDVQASIGPMMEIAAHHSADAYVAACFSDPGIEEMRETLNVPVFGIGESAVLAAMSLGKNVGIISGVEAAIPRHYRYWEYLGITNRIIGDVATGRGVLDLESEGAYRDILTTGGKLTKIGADVLVLGCTGMTHVRSRLQDELGVPIIDPCQAALNAAALNFKD